MDKLKTSTILNCSACGKEIPMFEECLVDGINHCHIKCKPEVKTMDVKLKSHVINGEKENSNG